MSAWARLKEAPRVRNFPACEYEEQTLRQITLLAAIVRFYFVDQRLERRQRSTSTESRATNSPLPVTVGRQPHCMDTCLHRGKLGLIPKMAGQRRRRWMRGNELREATATMDATRA